MINSDIIRLLNSFTLDFNKNYRYIGFSNEKLLKETYEISFFKNLHRNKCLPRVGNCIWFSYLLDLFLRKYNLDSKVCLIKFFDEGELKIHFIVNLNVGEDVFYLDLMDNKLIISKHYDLLLKYKNNLGENFIFSELICYDYKNFESEILRNIFKKSLSDWDLEIMLERLLNLYTSEFKFDSEPKLNLEVRND